MVVSRLRQIALPIASAAPRIVSISAPAGYEKTGLAGAIAAHFGPLSVCRFTSDGTEIAGLILDSLVSGDRTRAARFSADRLASRRRDVQANIRAGLRSEWSAACEDQVLMFQDADGALATPAGADIFGELVHTLPARRRLVIATRLPLPLALEAAVPASGTVTVTRADLALSYADVVIAARLAGLEDDAAMTLFELTRGWPMVTDILIDLLRTEPPDEIVEAARSLSDTAIFAFAVHRSIARLPDQVREALVVASFFPEARYLDIIRILGPECDDAVFSRMGALPYVTHDDDRAKVHSEVGRLLSDRFPSIVEPLYERALMVLSDSGRHAAAAQLALDAGDGVRAAELIDAAPPFTAAPVPIGDYERVLKQIDPEIITRYPNVWIATIPYRSFSVDPATYIREAESIFFCLPRGASPDQRAAALMILVSGYANAGRSADGEELLVEALGGFASDDTAARASLLNLRASLHGIEGRFSQARALATEAARISRDPFGENQTLHYIEAHEAAFRGRQERIVVILDELLLRRGRVEPPLYRAYVAMNGALFSWANGDDDAFERYQTAFEDAITPAIEAALAPLIDAARGRSARIGDLQSWPLYVTMAQLYAMGTATTTADAVSSARAAVTAADIRKAPYSRTLAHIALFVLDESARPKERTVLADIASGVESPEWREAIAGLLSGSTAGMLEPFVRKRVLRARASSTARLTVELLANRVTRDGQDVRLRGKEFELIALLASTRGSLSRDEIGASLWGHLDEAEWSNNLKVTLYRVRKAVGTREITVSEGSRNRLAPAIDVDLGRAEALVRSRSNAPLSDQGRDELRSIILSFRDGTIERYERFSWSHSLVARLNDLACGCGIALGMDALQRGKPDEALGWAVRVRDIDHLNEKASMIAIRALHRAGDVDAARREFQRYTADLAREFATAPSISLSDLVGT